MRYNVSIRKMLGSENHLYFELEIVELHCIMIIHILKNKCLEWPKLTCFVSFFYFIFVPFKYCVYLSSQINLHFLLHVLVGSRMLASVYSSSVSCITYVHFHGWPKISPCLDLAVFPNTVLIQLIWCKLYILVLFPLWLKVELKCLWTANLLMIDLVQ